MISGKRSWNGPAIGLLTAVSLSVRCGPPEDSAVQPSSGPNISNESQLVIDSLPAITAAVDLTIGDRDREGEDFTSPIPLGADPAGDAYVLDTYQREIRRFDGNGRFKDVAVQRGPGPGEMEMFPFTYGMLNDVIWYSEYPRSTLQYVPLDQKPAWVVDTGITAARVGADRILVWPLGSDTFLVETASDRPDLLTLRPTSQITYIRFEDGAVDTLYSYTRKAPFLLLDQGRSTVTYPGPADHPVVVYDEATNRFLRIERPISTGPAQAQIILHWLDSSGNVSSRRQLSIPRSTLSAARRDSIGQTLLNRASFGGRRTIGPELRNALTTLVASIPSALPAFDEVTRGADGTIWLRIQHAVGEQRWLVVDSLFNPVAQASTPANVRQLFHTHDGAWWATFDGDLGVQYVGRLRLDQESVMPVR